VRVANYYLGHRVAARERHLLLPQHGYDEQLDRVALALPALGLYYRIQHCVAVLYPNLPLEVLLGAFGLIPARAKVQPAVQYEVDYRRRSLSYVGKYFFLVDLVEPVLPPVYLVGGLPSLVYAHVYRPVQRPNLPGAARLVSELVYRLLLVLAEVEPSTAVAHGCRYAPPLALRYNHASLGYVCFKYWRAFPGVVVAEFVEALYYVVEKNQC